MFPQLSFGTGRRRHALGLAVVLGTMTVGLGTFAGITALIGSSASSPIWMANATKPIDQEWASMSTGQHCSVTTFPGMTDPNVFQVSDPTAVYGRAYRSQITTADNSQPGCYTSNLREEIAQGNSSKTFADHVDRTFHEGQDRWISMQIKLDPTFPSHAQGFKGSSIVQLTHPSANDGGLFNLNVSNSGGPAVDQWDIWGYTNTTPGNQNRYDHPLGSLLPDRGKWVRFTFHILFSSTSAGFAEVYSDLANPGGPVALLWHRAGPTIKAPRPYAFMTFGFYAYRPVPATIGAELAGLNVAADRATAEAAAFGTSTATSSSSTTSTTTTSSTTTTPALVTTAAFIAGPQPSKIGGGVILDGSTSTCANPPCTYRYSDANNDATLGTSQTSGFYFHYAGTKRITLTITDATGQTTSVEHDHTVQ